MNPWPPSQDLSAGPVVFRAMLPPDSLWIRAAATAPFETVMACDGVWGAQLYQERGTLFVFLDRQRPHNTLRRVRCTGLA